MFFVSKQYTFSRGIYTESPHTRVYMWYNNLEQLQHKEVVYYEDQHFSKELQGKRKT